MTYFRKRIRSVGFEKILSVSVALHGASAIEEEMCVDTTVKKKHHLSNGRLARHPRNRKKARHAVKRLKTIAGRLLREIQRQMNGLQQQKYHKTLSHYQRVLKQKRGDKNKIYSLHEPHIYCMSKGKDHKKYEFGTKASVAKTRIHIPKPPRNNASKVMQDEMRKRFQRRAEIEPVIGHLKSDHRLNRSFLKGFTADQINLLMATAAFNFKKWMREVYFGLRISGSYLHR